MTEAELKQILDEAQLTHSFQDEGVKRELDCAILSRVIQAIKEYAATHIDRCGILMIKSTESEVKVAKRKTNRRRSYPTRQTIV